VSFLLYRSVSLIGKLHRDILGELQEAAYFNREKNFENRLIGTFHDFMLVFAVKIRKQLFRTL
jgi:hypothetical protein